MINSTREEHYRKNDRVRAFYETKKYISGVEGLNRYRQVSSGALAATFRGTLRL